MLRSCIALTLVGAAILPVATAAASAASPAPINAVATQTSNKMTGKTQHITETLRVGGKVIGTDKITCLVQSQTVGKCSAVFALTKGQITVAGTVRFDQPVSKLAIVGGTGSYTSAKGTMTLKFGASNKASEVFAFS